MLLKPVRLALERSERGRADSDVTFFYDLLIAGELVLKIVAASLVAALHDDREKHRYRLLHTLVRADGIGDWSKSIDDCLSGTASPHLLQEIQDERRIFTERLGSDAWQYQATALLMQAVARVLGKSEPIPAKLALRSWFERFPELRNKTRGHGAPTPSVCSNCAPLLAQSIDLVVNNIPLFGRPWAHLHRNLSGKYRVTPLGGDPTPFNDLRTRKGEEAHIPDGIYVFMGAPRRVELLTASSDVDDFFLPNGAFNGRRFELLSLLTDTRRDGDAQPYLAPAEDRPASETDGARRLEIIGNVFTNIPPTPRDYVPRPALEADIFDVLTNDRHPIVTLVGRGGIGKTSAALTVLHRIAKETEKFDAIVWLSARDIDLTGTGPKVVQPRVVTETDIAREFFELMQPVGFATKSAEVTEYFASNLRSSTLNGSILFVFDNFETTKNPIDLFQWLDMNVRLPNKLLITTRFREFKADFPIAVSGMQRNECDELVKKTAAALGISSLISSSYYEIIYQETEGHPYIAKMTLGEVAHTRQLGKPSKIIAKKEDLLDALFERTYAGLSPLAKRVFLTLSAWRSLVPRIALEAVILRNENEAIDPSESVAELQRMSMIEVIPTDENADFLQTPLTATLFGQKKLNVSPNKILIENDIKMLMEIGPTNSASIKMGIQPRLRSLFRRAALRIEEGTTSLDEETPMLEFIAREFPVAWLWIASLHEENEAQSSPEAAPEAVRRYLQTDPEPKVAAEAWLRLAHLYRNRGSVLAAAHAFAKAFELADAPLNEISNTANWLNNQHQAIGSMERIDREAVFGSLVSAMERHLNEASATDMSRLAWLHLHAGHDGRARALAMLGLEKDPENLHCQRLAERLR